MKKILLTGGLGGLGREITKNLAKKSDIEVIVYDLSTRENKKLAKDEKYKIDHISFKWGDITKKDTLPNLSEIDAIIHMAFILPPKSETLQDVIVERINIGGMKNLLEKAKEDNFKGKIVLASSVSVYGPTLCEKEPLKVNHPVNPTDRYTYHKVYCENLLKKSGLKWLILRISAAPYLKVDLNPESLKTMFSIPYNQRFELIHPDDAATAFTNAALCDAEEEIFHVAGGEKCRMKYHEMLEETLGVFNLPPPDESKYTTSVFYIDYYDTKRSQEVLQFQSRTFKDYLIDFENSMDINGKFIKSMAPIAKFFI